MNERVVVLIFLCSGFALVAPASRYAVKGTRVTKVGVGAQCPDTFTPVGGYCYYISNKTSSSWYQAVKQCHDLNAYLATISSTDENTALKEYLATVPDVDTVNGWWLGGSDEALEGEWRWKSNLKKFCLFDWCHGEPNNVGSENCLAMVPECDMQWNDRACDYKHFRYVCEPYPTT